MTELVLTFPPATGNHATRVNHKTGRFYTLPAIKKYRLSVLCDVVKGLNGKVKAYAYPVRVELLITPPDARRRDSGNIVKVLYDALTRARFWEDDSLVREEVINWTEPVKGGACIRMKVSEIKNA